MRNRRKLVGKVLMSIATVSGESASIFGLYEPKMPEQLQKKLRREKCQKVNKDV